MVAPPTAPPMRETEDSTLSSTSSIVALGVGGGEGSTGTDGGGGEMDLSDVMVTGADTTGTPRVADAWLAELSEAFTLFVTAAASEMSATDTLKTR